MHDDGATTDTRKWRAQIRPYESEMADRILKSSISIFEPFNDVRNNRSLARDNPILNYERHF